MLPQLTIADVLRCSDDSVSAVTLMGGGGDVIVAETQLGHKLVPSCQDSCIIEW